MRKHASVLVAACGRAGWLQHRPPRARLQNTRRAHQGQFEGQSREHEATRKHARFMLASSFIADEQRPGIFLPIRTGFENNKMRGSGDYNRQVFASFPQCCVHPASAAQNQFSSLPPSPHVLLNSLFCSRSNFSPLLAERFPQISAKRVIAAVWPEPSHPDGARG